MATLTAPTLAKLIKLVRMRLRQPNAANSNYSDSELTEYLNDAVKTYFLEVEERAEGQFDTTATLDIVANQDTVPLPADCYKVRKLSLKHTSEYVALQYRNDLEDSWDVSGLSATDIYEPFYYFRGGSIVLRPIPNTSNPGSLLLEYTSFPDTMIWGGDSLTAGISPIFRELVVFYAVYQAKVTDDMVNGGNTRAAAAEQLSQLYSQFVKNLGLKSKFPQFVKPYLP